MPAEVLSEQLRAEEAAVAAYVALSGLPLDAGARASELRTSASARIDRLEAAGGQARRYPGRAARRRPGWRPRSRPSAALCAPTSARSASCATRKWSELLGGLITSSAAHETALLELLERPPLPSAFPGQPIA